MSVGLGRVLTVVLQLWPRMGECQSSMLADKHWHEISTESGTGQDDE